MRASEIIRKIADVLDAQEANQSSSTEITNRPDQSEVDAPTDTKGIEGAAQVNTKSMVAPLQQKLDLMKRLAGEEECEPEQDELAIMRQNAGIQPAVIAIADEDEPFEG